MNTDNWVIFAGIIVTLVGMGVGHLIDDPAFHIRMVQAGNHEMILILLGLIIGFTFKDQKNESSLDALIWAIFMAVFGLFMGGLKDLESAMVQYVGYIFYIGFISALTGTVVNLMRALRFYLKH
ncbi:hypothetical protein [Halomonas sp. GD1P12]|uniref:hypothetical protein n=1 Tax=Halomonas sp. GD1P12 TaxID=2982691 RepID=UPI0021E4C28E|nr:hypothetical protein [Halomonas sp. GD1P12]UYF99344.1 hypothetical protein OCT39_14065 [Halomonas sp. GD1P12]